jgi:hypothetical protein
VPEQIEAARSSLRAVSHLSHLRIVRLCYSPRVKAKVSFSMLDNPIEVNLRRIERHRATLELAERGTWLNPRASDRQRLLDNIAELEAVNAWLSTRQPPALLPTA